MGGGGGEFPVREYTGNLVCSSCKFPDSKGKRYLTRKFPEQNLKLDKSAKSFCVCASAFGT